MKKGEEIFLGEVSRFDLIHYKIVLSSNRCFLARAYTGASGSRQQRFSSFSSPVLRFSCENLGFFKLVYNDRQRAGRLHIYGC